MVVKSDGTKWACLSCLKGHRVSGCTHTDRELVLVPKKGRPVTQCHHCRLERKKRSAHVKCDCGEQDKPHHSKEKCIHLREAEERLKAGGGSGGSGDDAPTDKDVSHLVTIAEAQGCCCGHGGKCSCSLLKREPKDGAADDTLSPHGPAVKPRLEPTRSEGSITVFQNGHHKPVHRKNHAAHECGMPYKLPMSRANTDQQCSAKGARRSVDSLASSSGHHHHSHPQPPPLCTDVQASSSEQSSPHGGSCHDITPAQTSVASSVTGEAYPFPTFDAMSGIADDSFDPWSSTAWAESSTMPDNNPFGVWPTNDTNNLAQPALTAASSGTRSEEDEMSLMDDIYNFGMPSIQENMPSLELADGQGTGSPQANRRSLPPNFFSQSDFLIPELQAERGVTFPEDDPNKTKSMEQTTTPSFDDIWQSSLMPSNTGGYARLSNGLPATNGRPASHSVGPASAPTDEFMQQLFPGIELPGTFFSSDSPQPTSQPRIFIPGQTASMDFDPNETKLAPSQWNDGSINVPVSPNTYDLEQEFSDPDFVATWTQ